MIIRITQGSDYSELMLLYNGFVGEDRYSNHNNDSFKKVLKSKNNSVYVVEENKKLVGFAAFSVRTVVRYPKPIAELDELYVLPAYRRKGIGQKLMKKILNKAKQLNCYRIFIESHYDHKSAHKL